MGHITAHTYPSTSYGGQWVFGGGAPSSALAPSTAHLTQATWDDTPIVDPRHCVAEAKEGGQCRAWPKKGTQHCWFHTVKAENDGPEPSAD